MKPLIKWSGGKSDELDLIMPHIPINYETYIEPFVGGGALYFHLEPKKAVINDIHKELIIFYQTIKSGKGEKIYELMNEYHNTEETYYNIRKLNPKTKLLKAFQFYYLRKTCYRGMLRYNSSGKFNVAYGKYKKINYEDVKNKNYIKMMKNTEILNKDFEEIFKKFGDNKNNFCFIDQPYDSVFVDYGYCKFEKKDQERLSEAFKNTKMKCLMIVGDTKLIRNLYNGYIVDSYPKKYRFKFHSGRIGNSINTNHLIIKNY